MDREESLGKRLLSYLGLTHRIREHFYFPNSRPAIDVVQPQAKNNDTLICYSSWHSLLFGHPGRYGLCNLHKWFCDNDDPWFEYKLKAFRFENLDELEMQLSIRGF